MPEPGAEQNQEDLIIRRAEIDGLGDKAFLNGALLVRFESRD